MKEALEPIILISLTIFAVGSALLMPILVYAAYKELIVNKK